MALQFNRLFVGGSRERPSASQLPGVLIGASKIGQPLEQTHHETFAGAARCKPIELPPDKAAPLQALQTLPTAISASTAAWEQGLHSY